MFQPAASATHRRSSRRAAKNVELTVAAPPQSPARTVFAGPPTTVVHLPERFDAHRLDVVTSHHPAGDLVIDGRRVEFLDAAAVSTLVEAMLGRLDAGFEFRVNRPSDSMRVILELAGNDMLLNLTSFDDDADVALEMAA